MGGAVYDVATKEVPRHSEQSEESSEKATKTKQEKQKHPTKQHWILHYVQDDGGRVRLDPSAMLSQDNRNGLTISLYLLKDTYSFISIES